MKSFSKRVASFTMAAAMVLSLAAVSPVDAQAAKKASITKKTSITAGKTYTYKIKNVTSKQYVKVTGITSGVKVKYNNKTVKKNSTKIYGKKSGAALALKVTAKDKVANYKATIKAQVYNKSNNKKVGSLLKTTTKVKCTKLEVTSVTAASTSGKYLVATFSKALSKLSVADITIVNTKTGELKGVEKVELASDGKSATITLVGSEDIGAGGFVANLFVEPNVDYTFSVAQSGAKASTTFSIDGVVADTSVVAVDAKTRSITTDGSTAGTIGDGTYTIPTSMEYDFQNLLGRTVTFSADENAMVTKLTLAKEDVFYASLKMNDHDQSALSKIVAKDQITGTEYKFQETSGNLKETKLIKKNTTGYAAADDASNKKASDLGKNSVLDYAKVVRYNNGNIRTVVYDKTYTGSILVDKVEGDNISAGTKTVVNLKDYLIVKDGATVSVAAIAVGDVVFYDTTNKFAEIYTSSKTGDLQAAYSDGYKFGDVIYKIGKTNGYLQFVDGSNGVKFVGKDEIASFLKGGPSATIYFDRANKPVFIKGTQAAVVSNTVPVVLTADGKYFKQALVDTIRLKGYNGTEVATYDIDASGLEKIVTSGNKVFNKGNSVTTNKATEYTVTGFAIKSNGEDNASWQAAVTANSTLSVTGGYENVIAAVGTDFAKIGLVELTVNDKNKVTGISYVAKKDVVSGNLKAGASNVVLRNGTSLQIASTVPVYLYNTTDDSVSKTTYGEFKDVATDGNADVYDDGKGNVKYVVVKGAKADAVTYVEAVVSSSLDDKDSKLVNLDVCVGKEPIKTYTSFSEAAAKYGKIATGTVVRLGISSDGKTVQSIDKTDIGTAHDNKVVSANGINPNEQTIVLSDNTIVTMASSVVPTVVKVVTNAQGIQSLEYITLSELKSYNVADYKIDMTTLAGTNFIDTLVVKMN